MNQYHLLQDFIASTAVLIKKKMKCFSNLLRLQSANSQDVSNAANLFYAALVCLPRLIPLLPVYPEPPPPSLDPGPLSSRTLSAGMPGSTRKSAGGCQWPSGYRRTSPTLREAKKEQAAGKVSVTSTSTFHTWRCKQEGGGSPTLWYLCFLHFPLSQPCHLPHTSSLSSINPKMTAAACRKL